MASLTFFWKIQTFFMPDSQPSLRFIFRRTICIQLGVNWSDIR